MREFSVICPKCSTAAELRPDRLGDQFRCRRCRAEFYVDNGGRMRLGKRPKEQGAFDPYATVRFEPTRFLPDLFGVVPRFVWLVAAGLAAVVLGVAGFLWLTAPEIELPESLEGRAAMVASAFARNDQAPILAVSAPGDRRDLKAWLKRSRPGHWDWDEADAIEVRTETVFSNSKTGLALVVATINAPTGSVVPPPPPPPTSKRPGPPAATGSSRRAGFELPLFWTLGDRGQWLLDTSRTLRESPGTL